MKSEGENGIAKQDHLLFEKTVSPFYRSEYINLDFHSIPHYGDESEMEKVWCGARGKRYAGLVESTLKIPDKEWKKVYLAIPKREYKRVFVYESKVKLPNRENTFR